jgi:hypothetical protein
MISFPPLPVLRERAGVRAFLCLPVGKDVRDDPPKLDYEAHADARKRRRPVSARHVIMWAILVCLIGFVALKLFGV